MNGRRRSTGFRADAPPVLPTSQRRNASMTNAASRTEQIIEQPGRVRRLRRLVEATADGIWPAIDLTRPYVDGTENLPRDGRFILVGNHTQTGMAEAWLTCLSVRRITGTRVRPLT